MEFDGQSQRSDAVKEHELKTWPEFFVHVFHRRKNFEIRKNDRDFQVGDKLKLREYDPEKQSYSGRTEFRRITYIAKNLEHFGLPKDVVVLSMD
jgi:hypothetical protein